MKSVVLRTALAVRTFESMASQMESVDYDLVETIKLIVEVLSNRKGLDEAKEDFIEGYKTWGSLNEDLTEDGVILSNAVAFLFGSIQTAIESAELYDQYGTLPYVFGGLLTRDVILVAHVAGLRTNINTPTE